MRENTDHKNFKYGHFLHSVGLIKFSKALRKQLEDRQLRISGSRLFYSLVTRGKKEFCKYSVLQLKEVHIFGCFKL